MGFYETKRDGTVKRALAKYGQTMKLVAPGAGAFNPVTGAFNPSADALYTVQGLFNTQRKGRQVATVSPQKDLSVYVGASGLSVEPSQTHKLRIGIVDYDIVNVEKIAPGGIAVMYLLQVRLP